MALRRVYASFGLLFLFGILCSAQTLGLKSLWTTTLRGSVDFIEVDGKNIFTSTSDGTIYLLTSSGRVKWSRTFDSRVTAITLNSIYAGVALENRELILMDLNGNRIWNVLTENYIGFEDALHISDEGFYAGDMAGFVYYFDFQGNLISKVHSDAYVVSVNEVGGNLEVISDKGLYFLVNGTLIEKFFLKDYVRIAESNGDYSILASGEGDVFLVDKKGELVWRKMLTETVGAVYPSSHGICAGTKEEGLYVFDFFGDRRWYQQVDGSITRVFLNEDYVLASTISNLVYVFNWRGRLRWVNHEEYPITSFNALGNVLLYGNSRGELKYFVLTSRSRVQHYIVFLIMGLTIAVGFWWLLRIWHIS